jgi:hypothetical protein
MADIVLKDRSGNPVEYPGVEAIKVNTVDGGTQEFVASERVETTIDLDDEATNFANNDVVEVTPEAGTVFNKVNIPIPQNLTPENIAEGVDIAGIIGTLAAGGGVKIAAGTISAASIGTKVTHGLGVVPDVILAAALSTGGSGSLFIKNVWGASSALRALSGYPNAFVQQGCYYSGATLKPISINFNITTTDTTKPINNANAESFTLGSTTYPVLANTTWLAIGGLT